MSRSGDGSSVGDDRLFKSGTRFGKYEIVRRLAVGGMAEIYLARATGIEGFEKLVVLKHLLPQHAKDQEVVAMFLDEARLAATLEHPNLVPVQDIGEQDGDYFFTMEYVRGVSLDAIIAAAERSGRVPIEHAITIIQGVAAGLHHAHEKASADGRPLGIVHRDVTPANVLVTFDGAVKVVDFGIAKANTSRRRTRAGEIKGTISYMSPEQCRGGPLDRRSDVHGIGLLLYELTTGRPVFAEGTEYEILHKVVNEEAPLPSTHVPDYPIELETIVTRALRHSPDERFATAQELQLALERFARASGLVMSNVELGRYVRELFPERARPPAPQAQPTADPDRPLSRATVATPRSREGALRAAGSSTPLQRRTAVVAMLAAAAVAAGLGVARLLRTAGPPPQGCAAGVAVGDEHACAWKADGTAWCWGNAQLGQTGAGLVGQGLRHLAPVQVLDEQRAPLAPVDAVAAGPSFACARKKDSTLWCWGRNNAGQLGTGEVRVGRPAPLAAQVRIINRPGGAPIYGSALAAGGEHVCYRRHSGFVACWGGHGLGQHGNGAPGKDHIAGPVEAPQDVVGRGALKFGRIASGERHSCGTAGDGTVWCWGGNDFGQLGRGEIGPDFNPAPLAVVKADGERLADMVGVAASRDHSCAFSRDGALWCWGDNGLGQLGAGGARSSPSAVPVVDGRGGRLDGVVGVGAGWTHTCALKRDGTVWCFGDNGFAQLGDGGRLPNSPIPIQVAMGPGGPPLDGAQALAVGHQFNCIRRADATIWCWGRNEAGQLGAGDIDRHTRPVRVRLPCP